MFRLHPQLHLRRVLRVSGDITPPLYQASEEGDVKDSTLVVQFSEPVNSATSDYVTGVTIKVNAVSVTIVSGTRQADQSVVHYVLATPLPDANDVITWEYSDAVGDIADIPGNQLGDVAAQTAVNHIGEHLRFDEISDGIHFMVNL